MDVKSLKSGDLCGFMSCYLVRCIGVMYC